MNTAIKIRDFFFEEKSGMWMMSQEEEWQERLNKVLTLYSAPLQKRLKDPKIIRNE